MNGRDFWFNALMAMLFALAAVCLWNLAVSPAAADGFTVLRIERGLPTASGRLREPSAAGFYRSRPTVNLRPRALVLSLEQPAPPNGCEGDIGGGGFREVSGRLAGRCFGAVE